MDTYTDTVHKTLAFIYVWTSWHRSDHADSRWIRRNSQPALAGSFQFEPVPLIAACYLTSFGGDQQDQMEIEGSGGIIRFYGNSYSAIHTPKGTRVQQEIRTTHT